MKGIVLLLALLQGYTFDPHSVENIWYRPKDCERLSETKRAYRQVVVQFGAMMPVGPSEGGNPPPTSTYVAPAHPDGAKVLFHFRPEDCKAIPNTPKYVCVDRNWHKPGASPSIWTEDISVKAYAGEMAMVED